MSFELCDVVAFVVAASAFELVDAERVFASYVSFPAVHADEGAWFASFGAEYAFLAVDDDVFVFAWASSLEFWYVVDDDG